MKFEVFKPMELAADLPKDVAESYQAIAAQLVKVTGEQVAIEEARNQIRAMDPVDVDSAAIDKMRKLSFGMMDLLREELRARTDLIRWFGEFLAAIQTLAGNVEAGTKDTRLGIVTAMESIGFERVNITDEITSLHPSVRTLIKRLGRLRTLAMTLNNAEGVGFSFQPRGDNLKRIEEINAALMAALHHAGSPLATAAFV